ncbi:hypothetical protein [Aeromonas caviae]|uniref:hypothetical protein n=1 Tax=Aeromonas caviae TaxID=648 RepID=UPI002B4817DB|nr:hypothetical protein [Aeromonas caviae]
MHNADRAVLRIGTGIGLATGICYGLALPMPHLGVIMAWVVLCRPGEPLSLGKGLLGGALLLAVMVGGVLLVPLLTHYALAAVLLVALLLYLLMQQAMAGKGAAAMVLPVWLLALGNPAFYIPAVMKTVTLAQQSTSLNARQAGQELVLSTLMGALLAFALWLGLSLWPSLLMLVLMLALMTLWLARRLVRLVVGRFPPSFWSNTWITALILFGPAIEDSATGKDVWLAAAMRCGLYLVVAGYGWLCILLLEQWWPVGRPLAEAKLGD